MSDMPKTEEEWKQRLTPEQYEVLRQKGTEAPFSGKYLKREADGMFACAACGNVIFSSDDQHESKSPGLAGWPSFSQVAKSDAVKLKEDNSMGMRRTEIVCANCGSHLGHLFEGLDDTPTGQHYCINSVALNFKPKK